MADKYLVLQAGDTAINYNGGSRWFDADLTTPVTDPTSSDNVIMGASAFPSAGQSLVVNSTAYCLSMDWTGATNSPTLAGSSQIRFYGNVIFIADMLFTNTGGILGYGTAGTQTITTNGMSFPACFLGMAGGTGGTLQFQDNINGIPSLYLAGGTLDTNDVTVNCGRILDSGSEPKVFDFGTSTINVSSVTGVSITGTNTSFSANTATINVSSTGAVALGNANWNGASFNLIGTSHTVSGSPTGIATFTRTGTATKTNTLTMTSGSNLTCGTFAMIGNSVTNRLLVQSSTLGTPATITATNWTGSANVDIMDITVTNPVDLSAITGGSGDCQGNTGITFTTAAAQTSTKASTWSDPTMWTSRTPLPQDDVTCSHSVTVDMPRIGKSVTFTGTPTVTKTNEWYVFGSLVNSSTTVYSGAGRCWLYGRSAYNLDTKGVNIYRFAISGFGGTYTLQSDILGSNSEDSDLYAGTFNTNGHSVTVGLWYFYSTATKVLNLGSSTIILTNATAAPKWYEALSGFTNLTLNAGTSTIILTNSTANAQTFAGCGLTYNNVQVAGAGEYALTVTGNNTFNNLTIDRTEASKSLVLTGTTQTVTNFLCPVSTTNTLTITGGTITKAGGGQIALDHLVLDTSTVTPAATWYAGEHSYILGGTVIGWIFGDPSGGGTRSLMPAIII